LGERVFGDLTIAICVMQVGVVFIVLPDAMSQLTRDEAWSIVKPFFVWHGEDAQAGLNRNPVQANSFQPRQPIYCCDSSTLRRKSGVMNRPFQRKNFY
jgi:hypothetical protein